MYGCESQTIKKAEHPRIDAFELWCWRRLLRVPWTERRSNQSILKEINHEYSLEELMLKLKLQYFGQLMQRADSFEKTLMLGKTEGRRRMGWHRVRWLDGYHRLDGHEFEQSPGGDDGQGSLLLLQSMGSRTVGHDWVTELKLNQSGLLPHCPPRPKTVCRWQAGYEVLMLVVGATWDMFGPKLPWLHP